MYIHLILQHVNLANLANLAKFIKVSVNPVFVVLCFAYRRTTYRTTRLLDVLVLSFLKIFLVWIC
jgi:hypothetical protein